ncbi:MAG TPA: hypothetical protein VHD87_00625 [Acidimicrobiales bacterium]|nr:hypothetical protein [Acidimicrobiales bacterium]
MRRTAMGAAAAACGLLLTGATATPAWAQPTATTQVSIADATKGACSNGMATWTVHPDITITNDSSGTDTISDVYYTGKYNAGGRGQTTTTDTQVTDTDGLDAGTSIAPQQRASYQPTVLITIPCDATSATLFVNYDLVNGHKTFLGGAPFLTSGTAAPTGAVGALGLIAVVGIVLALRRKPAAAEPQLTATR